jgi:hypothetical protein
MVNIFFVRVQRSNYRKKEAVDLSIILPQAHTPPLSPRYRDACLIAASLV